MNVSINSVYFLFLSFSLLFGAILTIASKKMVYSLLWSMITFISIGGLFFVLDTTYNAIVQLLVYVVAIPILIAVSIMLIKPEQENKNFSYSKFLSVLGIITFIILLTEFTSINYDIFQIIKSCFVYVNPYSDLISISKNILGIYPVFLFEFGLATIVTVMGICFHEK